MDINWSTELAEQLEEGPYSEYPLAALVLHINREALHHGAEIALLRDLYQAKGHDSDAL